MNFLAPELQSYISDHSSPESELLARLRRETHQKVLYPQMLSSAEMGRFMAMISQLVQPRRILEVGTFTGYSCLCLAEGPGTGWQDHHHRDRSRTGRDDHALCKRSGQN